MKFTSSLLLFFLLSIILCQAQSPPKQNQWADSLLQSMSQEEKIGQLFMLAAYTNKGVSHTNYVGSLIQKYHIGSLIFMQGSPNQQVKDANYYQSISKTPLLIAQDAEWGPSMRLKNCIKFPRNMTLGAIQDDSLIYDLGQELARQLKIVGVQMNLAPVVDVNNNAANPVINDRSFGENKFNVSRKGIMYAKGMEDAGVLACAKHFPGHGDTDTDSHLDLPIINHDKSRLDTLELYPFVKMKEADVSSMMIAHLYIPALDSTKNRASTLSPAIVKGVLRDAMGYEGLIMTDALNMKGVTKFYSPGEVDVLALKAGNDILLFPENIPKAQQAIKEAIEKGEISQQELDEHVKRVLVAKQKAGLNRSPIVSSRDIESSLNTQEAKVLKKRLFHAAMTLVKNEGDIVPINQLEKRKIAYLQVAGGSENKFDMNLRKYAEMGTHYLRKGFSSGEGLNMQKKLEPYNTVIVGIFGMSRSQKYNFGITQNTLNLIQKLKKDGKEVIVTLFGSPYSLQSFGEHEDAILLAYQDDPDAELAAAAAIFGGEPITGKLPITASPQFPEGTGIIIAEATRFGFALPEEEGMDSYTLNKIDSIANHYIGEGATPGCAILVMRNNHIVYEKGFGKSEYGYSGYPIDPYETMYDVASITKVAATTLMSMYLIEHGIISLDQKVQRYIPKLKGYDHGKITIRELLLHRSGLPAGIAYQMKLFKEGTDTLRKELVSFQADNTHDLEIAPGMYAIPTIVDSVWTEILSKKVRTKRHKYSDLSMVMLKEVIESATGMSMETYLRKVFYEPMGMNKSCFNPGMKGLEMFCPPTEIDNYWRHCTVQGFVHDPTSALLGGCGGNAGLFCNIYDLAKLMLMLENKGQYGNRIYLNESTVRQFTKKQRSDHRRGLGWDRKEVRKGRYNPTSDLASSATFGHTGFTGTAVWVDPTYDLVYICLSNRTFPDANNRLFQREHVREQLMDQVYHSMKAFDLKRNKNEVN